MSEPEWVDCHEEWAFWVDPETFLMPRVEGTVKVGALVLVKESTMSDAGRNLVSTKFTVATVDGLEPLGGKKETNAKLVRDMVAFMRRTGAWPPKAEIKKSYKNGNIDIAFEPGRYDTFTLRLTADLLDGDPKELLDALKPAAEPEPAKPFVRPVSPVIAGVPWCVEHAKSSRATCRSCGAKIGHGELRLGEPSEYDGRLSYKWHHVPCAAQKIPDFDDLDGRGNLSASEHDEVKRRAKGD